MACFGPGNEPAQALDRLWNRGKSITLEDFLDRFESQVFGS